MIHYAYLNESPFKYYISFIGVGGWGVWGHAYCAYLGGGGPKLGKTCLYNTCTLPYLLLHLHIYYIAFITIWLIIKAFKVIIIRALSGWLSVMIFILFTITIINSIVMIYHKNFGKDPCNVFSQILKKIALQQTNLKNIWNLLEFLETIYQNVRISGEKGPGVHKVLQISI